MIIVYIAHPIGGNVEKNLEDLRRIVKKINLEFPGVVPFVPYYSDVVSLDDNIPGDRERGTRNNTAILKSGIVDEVWLTGDRMSKGMQDEADLALSLGIDVNNWLGI